MMERITQSMLANNALYGMRKTSNRMADINAQMSSGKRINFASDDPASSVDSMRLRKQLASTEQYQRNIDDASSWMTTADSAMQSISDKYASAKTSLIQANSGAQGAESLKAIAADLRQQAEALMNQSNATYLGRTVFAGNSDKGTVFQKLQTPNGIQFVQSDSDAVTASPVTRQINSNQKVQVNVDGNQLFGTGTINWKVSVLEKSTDDAVTVAKSVTDGNTTYYKVDNSVTPAKYFKLDPSTGEFATQAETNAPTNPQETKIDISYSIDPSNNPNVMNLLVAAADMLDSGSVNQSKMEAIQGELARRTSELQTQMSTLGAAHKQVIDSQDSIQSDLMQVQSQISSVEDVDIQKLTIDMALADMSYKASLSATQRVVQPTLLDYLR